MSKANKRSIGTAQLKLRELNIICAGESGSPEILGFDRLVISSVQDLGIGEYKINFKSPFNRDCMLKGWSSMTVGVVECVVDDVEPSSITINLLDVAGAAIDGDIALCIIGSDARYDIA